MDKPIGERRSQRHAAPYARLPPSATRAFCRRKGGNRIRGMVETQPDWVICRQRAWGVPHRRVRQQGTADDAAATDFRSERAHRAIASLRRGRRRRLVRARRRGRSLATSSTTLALREDRRHPRCLVRTPARPTPSCSKSRADTRWPADLYLEGSDQHRGWFQSSLLEAWARAAAPRSTRCSPTASSLDEDGREDVEVARQRGRARRT